MKEMIIKCPKPGCGRVKFQKVPDTFLEKLTGEQEKEELNLVILKDTICKHDFVVHIDKDSLIDSKTKHFL